MKSAFLTGQQEFEVKEISEPRVPEDGVVLEVKACGICGSDLRRWKEGPPQASGGIVPGHEAGAVVVAAGKKQNGFSVGDKLAVAPDIHCGKCYYCQRGMFNLCDELKFLGVTAGYPGGFAEKMALTGQVLINGIVHRMPDGLSFLEAALAEPCCSVLACHEKNATGLADTVLVMGAGPIGCLHTVVAKSRGAEVIVSEPGSTRRKLAERFKPAMIIDPVNEDLKARVRDFTNGLGADMVICANPVAAAQTEAVELVRKRGKVILFGGLPKAEPMVTLNSNIIHYGEIEVVGAFSYHPRMHELALDLLWRKVIPAELVITHTFSLDDINQAYETAVSGEALKVVVTME